MMPAKIFNQFIVTPALINGFGSVYTDKTWLRSEKDGGLV